MQPCPALWLCYHDPAVNKAEVIGAEIKHWEANQNKVSQQQQKQVWGEFWSEVRMLEERATLHFNFLCTLM